MDEWYVVVVEESTVTIEFQISELRYWDPSVLATNPLRAEWLAGKLVQLSGPGATWMYAHAMAVATAAGAISVSLKSIAEGDEGSSLDSSSIASEVNESLGATILSALFRSGEFVSDAEIEAEVCRAENQVLQNLTRHLCITGKAPIKFYADCCRWAVKSGIESIYCFVPQYGLIHIYQANQEQNEHAVRDAEGEVREWLETFFFNDAQGQVIGIVGDPNVGKSVFSMILDRWREKFNLGGWRLDCDGQAPTPPWYLHHEGNGDSEFARSQRKRLKRDWCSEMEQELAQQLRRGKECLDFLIADLPGGDHRIEPAKRIPPGREIMFKWIDKFIIVQRADCTRERQWRDSLRAIRQDENVVAVITSEKPDEPLEFTGALVDGVWRGIAKGLDRSQLKQTADGPVEESFREFWNHLIVDTN